MELAIPEPFKERYCALTDDPSGFLSSLEQPLPKSFRVNTLKGDYDEVESNFKRYGISLERMKWYSDACVTDSLEAGSTIEHFRGAIYMQELVSMLPPLLVRDEIRSAKIVLDGCAAPGSKTTQAAAFMGNLGMIVANDIAYSRIRALKFNLEKTGTLNTIITNRDLRSFPHSTFDVILLDAPCSAEGTMRKNAELFTSWSATEIGKHSKLQKQLITKAYDMLAPGGAMVYSTCTFAPEENEAVLDHLIKQRNATFESFSLSDFTLSPPVESWNGEEFDKEVRKAARVWPHHNDTGGFFLAKIKSPPNGSLRYEESA